MPPPDALLQSSDNEMHWKYTLSGPGSGPLTRCVLASGDQASDLAGGHAERVSELPNPMYLTP